MIPERFIDEMNARISLPDLVGRRVRLAKRGGDHVGLCPFHHERSPSFHVNAERFHCFGCGAHGDAVGWVMQADGRSFRDAVEDLAREAGLDVPAEAGFGQNRARGPLSQRDGARQDGARAVNEASREYAALAALRDAAAWYAARLHEDSATAGWARDYLARRGIDDDIAKRFGLGFAPGGDAGKTALREALLARGHGLAALLDAGLAALDETGRDLGWDRFRLRVMIPIRDHAGAVVGFGGRALEPKAPAKYLNSPNGPVFDKSKLLFNLDRARALAQQAGRRLLIVEGYMDVIALDAHGFGHAVAPMGTALTEPQLRRAWRLAPEPVICMDGDAAGWKAALRVLDIALPLIAPGRGLGFVLLPEGKDPDELLRGDESGAAVLRGLLEKPLSVADMIWARAWGEIKAGDGPAARAAAEAELHALWRLIADPVMARHIGDDISGRLDRARATYRRSVGSLRGAGDVKALASPAPKGCLDVMAAADSGDAAMAKLAYWLEAGAGCLSLPDGMTADRAAKAIWLQWAQLGAALAWIEIADDFLWRPAEPGEGRQALLLRLEDAEGRLCDVLALDLTQRPGAGDCWRYTGGADAMGWAAVSLSRVKGAARPLLVFDTPIELIQAWLTAGAPGLLEEFGFCPLSVDLNIEAALAGVAVIAAPDEEMGEIWQDRLAAARRKRREGEWALPLVCVTEGDVREDEVAA